MILLRSEGSVATNATRNNQALDLRGGEEAGFGRPPSSPPVTHYLRNGHKSVRGHACTECTSVAVVVERRKLQGESFERIRSCTKRGPAFIGNSYICLARIWHGTLVLSAVIKIPLLSFKQKYALDMAIDIFTWM